MNIKSKSNQRWQKLNGAQIRSRFGVVEGAGVSAQSQEVPPLLPAASYEHGLELPHWCCRSRSVSGWSSIAGRRAGSKELHTSEHSALHACFVSQSHVAFSVCGYFCCKHVMWWAVTAVSCVYECSSTSGSFISQVCVCEWENDGIQRRKQLVMVLIIVGPLAFHLPYCLCFLGASFVWDKE